MKHKLGDTAYEVEWCSELPLNEFDEPDLNLAVYSFVIVAGRKQAEQCAASAASKSPRGYAIITPVEYSDPFEDGIESTFLWEPRGDSWEVRS